jgi:hypothetical protein
MTVRTSGPAGKTPVWNVKLTRDHLLAMGAITERTGCVSLCAVAHPVGFPAQYWSSGMERHASLSGGQRFFLPKALPGGSIWNVCLLLRQN